MDNPTAYSSERFMKVVLGKTGGWPCSKVMADPVFDVVAVDEETGNGKLIDIIARDSRGDRHAPVAGFAVERGEFESRMFRFFEAVCSGDDPEFAGLIDRRYDYEQYIFDVAGDSAAMLAIGVNPIYDADGDDPVRKGAVAEAGQQLDIDSCTLRDFCNRHHFHPSGVLDRIIEAADDSRFGYCGFEEISFALWMCAVADGNSIASLYDLRSMMRTELDPERFARNSYLGHPDLVDSIIEVSMWSPAITQRATRDNVVLLESSETDGETDRVAFSINGTGYTIDFANHTASRNDAYDTIR